MNGDDTSSARANQRILDQIDSAARLLARFGAKGRIAEYVARMRPTILRWVEDPSVSMPADPDFLNSYFELYSLYRIADTLDALKAASPSILNRVRTVLKDANYHVPQGSTKGREAQSELTVGALAQWAGLSPVWHPDGPDWRLLFQERVLVIEAKRISTDTAIENQIRKACRQLRDARMNGAVWLDVTACLTRAEWSWKVPFDVDPGAAMTRELDSRVAESWQQRVACAVDDAVDAVIFFGAAPIEFTPTFGAMRDALQRLAGRTVAPEEVLAYRHRREVDKSLEIVSYGVGEAIVAVPIRSGATVPDYSGFVAALGQAVRSRTLPN